MWTYWLMFLLPASAAIIVRGPKKFQPPGSRLAGSGFVWFCVWLWLTALIGFRYNVGGDWGAYLDYLLNVTDIALIDVFSKSDPGYQLLNWVSAKMNWDIYGVNLIGGAIFAFGLVSFCRSQPRPWLALTVAIPYLVIVVAMGYSRQGIALGLAMLGLVRLGNKSTLGFVVWVAMAATFHKSAVLLLPIAALATARSRYWTAVWVGLAMIILYYLLVGKDADALYTNYVVAQYQSEGAQIRLLMNALPAVILLIWRRRFRFAESEERLWTWFSIISLGFLCLLMTTPATTALDRMALYMLPLQLVVFGRLPHVLGLQEKHSQPRTQPTVSSVPGAGTSSVGGIVHLLTVAVLLYYGVVQFIWLNFAAFSHLWLPYRFYPLEVSF